MPPHRATLISAALPAAALALLLAAPAAALDPGLEIHQYARDHWTEDDGLPQNSVQAILQSRDGYLWLGTQEGLVRFDGVRFTVFDRSTTPALRANHVERLAEAPDGTLWVGTFGGGLVAARGGQLRALDGHDRPGPDGIRDLAVTPRGELWVGTDFGLELHAGGRLLRRFTRADGLPADEVRSLALDGDGTLWVGTAAGLARRAGEGFASLPLAGLPHPTVSALAADPHGNLWVGTAQGLARFAAGEGSFTRPPGAPADLVRALLVDRSGSLWVGTTRGLLRLAAGGGLPQELELGIVGALFEDREGSLWVGTDGTGLYRLKEGRAVTYAAAHGLGDEVVYSLTGDGEDGFWVGTAAGELYRLSRGRFQRISPRAALRGNTARVLLRRRDGTLWIGTELGLYQFDGRAVRLHPATSRLPGFPVRALAEDADGALWIGTDGGGLVRLAGNDVQVFTSRDGLASDTVRAILATPDGLWVGSYGGLSLLRQGRFTSWTTADGLGSPLVRSLHLDAAGVLWIGSYGGGLSRFADGRFTNVTSRDGLFNDVLYEILEDADGRLWFSCNRGIFSVAKRDLEAFVAGRVARVTSRSYGRNDGMLSRECNGGKPAAVSDRRGRLWFATVRGVVTIDPSERRRNLLPPPVVIEQVLVDGVPLDLPGPAVLAPGTRDLEFDYTALSLLAAERNRFAYRLEGLDDEWIEAGSRRQAYYTHLPPGRYRFRVRAANSDGVWNETGAAFDVELRPFFYQARWFFALCLLGAIGGGVGLHRLRVRGLRRRERELERRVDEALGRIKVLGGLLPICASCKKIRDDRGYWNQLEVYIRDRSHAEFTHSICPDCMTRLYPGFGERSPAP